MTDKKIIEEMARLNGFERIGLDGYRWRSKDGIIPIEKEAVLFPDYLNSHDACQRVIEGMKSNSQRRDYVYALDDMIHKGTVEPFYAHHVADIVVATPRQKCEAILKAANKWEG